MDKTYSVEEINRALELYELAKGGNALLESFFSLMKFGAGAYSDADRSHHAMEHLQELVKDGKYVIIDGEGDRIRIICDDSMCLDDAKIMRERMGKCYASFDEKDIPSGILNIKIEKGESNG